MKCLTTVVLVVLAAGVVVGGSCPALAQGVYFSLDGEGVGSNIIVGAPWAVYYSAPVWPNPGAHVGVTPPPGLYLPPDDNCDALYATAAVVPITQVLFSLDETVPTVELYRAAAKGQTVPTGVTETTLGLFANSNIDAFDEGPAMAPTLPWAPGDYSVDDPDPAGGAPPPGESEDIYGPIYQLMTSGVANIGLAPADNIDAWEWVGGSTHIFGNICPVTVSPFWPTGGLFSVDSGGSADPGDIFWYDATSGGYHLYMDDVNDLGLSDDVDIDAVTVLGQGQAPPWLVPEPATLALLGLGALGLIGRRRKK